MDFYEILVVIVMILLNGVFAAYELALASVRIERLRALVEEKKAGAKAALAMKGRMEASLAVVQVGITVFGVVAAAVGGASMKENIMPRLQTEWGLSPLMADVLSLTFFVVPVSLASIIVGELIPKTFGLRNADRVCLALSPLMQVMAAIAYPIVFFLEWITKRAMWWTDRLLPPLTDEKQHYINELRAQVGLLRSSQIIGLQQEQIIMQASRLSTMRVREIMLPADDIVMLDMEAPLTENIVTAHLDLHTRFPVTEKRGDAQGIVGYVNFKEMIFLAKTHPQHPHLREITRPLIRLRSDLAVSDALRRMVDEHVHLALVEDPTQNNRVIGMISQEDVFEELVGDIQDEFDRLPRQIVPSGRQWVVGGGATLARLREAIGKPNFATPMVGETTLNDWVVRTLGRRPKGGDILKHEDVTLLVRKVRRRHVTEALLDTTNASLETLRNIV